MLPITLAAFNLFIRQRLITRAIILICRLVKSVAAAALAVFIAAGLREELIRWKFNSVKYVAGSLGRSHCCAVLAGYAVIVCGNYQRYGT